MAFKDFLKLTALGLGAGVVLSGCESLRSGPGSGEALMAEPPLCSSRRFEVYFADSHAGLTPPAREAIRMTARQLEDCDIRSVRVVGLADARGGSAANLSLSERRAQAVADALTQEGWPAPAFEVIAAGDRGAMTADGLAEPLRRRVEVLVEAAPR